MNYFPSPQIHYSLIEGQDKYTRKVRKTCWIIDYMIWYIQPLAVHKFR